MSRARRGHDVVGSYRGWARHMQPLRLALPHADRLSTDLEELVDSGGGAGGPGAGPRGGDV